MEPDQYIHVGFSGTQGGMTEPQMKSLKSLLLGLSPGYLHHGWCIGADAEADRIGRDLGFKIIGHPPTVTKKMAILPEPFIMCDPKEYLDRNTDIALASEIFVATPKEYEEVVRSGTWSTIRRARGRASFICIIWPDGSWEIECRDYGGV